MGTILRIPTYTYYDNNTVNRQSSMSFILDDVLLNKVKTRYSSHGSDVWYEWSGDDVLNIPSKVNNAIGFPLLSKKTVQAILPLANETPNPSILQPVVSDILNKLYIEYLLHTNIANDIPSALYSPSTNTYLGVYTSGHSANNGYAASRDPAGVDYCYLGAYNYSVGYNFSTSTSKAVFDLQFPIYPESFVIGREFNSDYFSTGSHGHDVCYSIEIIVEYEKSTSKITSVQVSAATYGNMYMHTDIVKGMSSIGSDAQELDTDNPYGEGGSATVGGGDGKYGDIDAVNGTEIPDLPGLSAVDTGFISLYNPTTSQLKALYNFLWSNQFDLNTFKKLYADPMQCLISLGILPCVPKSSGATNIKFGNVDSGVNAVELASQFAQVDCGSIDIDKYIGSFLDYSPFVKISLFLPYIGFVHLGTDDIMGGSINVTYNIDCMSGDSIAFISHNERGVIYSYTGNCRADLPITSQNYTGFLKNYYQALTGVIPATINGAGGGAAGAIAGAAGGALSVAETVLLDNKPEFQRSGSCAGASGMIGVQTPFVIIERPRFSVPDKVQKYVGQTSNITLNLGDCTGFTAVEFVHLDGLNATSEEITEIESMLRSGVIF